jgi:hypothetical protein
MRSLGDTPRRRALLRVALYGGALFVGIPMAFAQVMTATRREGAPASPPEGYEELALASEEGLRLRAWLARGDPERAAAVVVHGLGDSLESYVGHARVLRERGHSVLLVDLRGHGGSEGSYTALGAREHADVAAAMAELRRRELAGRGILLEGHSMGAAAVLLAASREPGVRAVIAEAPYDSYRGTVEHHARLLYGIPRWVPLIPTAIAMAEWRAGFDADDADVVAAVRRITAPLLAIADGEDQRMPEPVVRRVYDAHPGPKQLWVAPGVDHVGAIQLAEYGPRVRGFLEENGL